jgi:hypothetical protein
MTTGQNVSKRGPDLTKHSVRCGSQSYPAGLPLATRQALEYAENERLLLVGTDK